jgi:hypothetical protein
MQRMANQVSKTACAAWALSHREAELSEVQQQRDCLAAKPNTRTDAHHETPEADENTSHQLTLNE